MKQVTHALSGFERRHRERVDNDSLYAVRAFSVNIARTAESYGQKHSVSIVPLASHSLQLGPRKELGDICLGNGDESMLKPEEVATSIESGILVTDISNIHRVWNELFQYMGAQESEVMGSSLWQEWKDARKAIAVQGLDYFSVFKKRVDEKLVPFAQTPIVYYTGMENSQGLCKLFEKQ